MGSKVQVLVEVTAETRPTSNGSSQQVVFVDVGSKYPVEATLFVDDKKGPLKPGTYVADRLYKKGFAFQLDLFNLKPVQTQASR